jgi:hypothetical protein
MTVIARHPTDPRRPHYDRLLANGTTPNLAGADAWPARGAALVGARAPDAPG